MNYRIRVKFEEWLTIEAVKSEDEALKIAYNITVDERGQDYADWAEYSTEQEVSS